MVTQFAKVQSRSKWDIVISILPMLHLVTCLIIAAAALPIAWMFMNFVDYPVSILVLFIMGSLGEGSPWFHPVIWYGLIGTAWWFFLSRVVLALIGAGNPHNRSRDDMQ